MEKDFPFPIFNLCAAFIRAIKFNRRCLSNTIFAFRYVSYIPNKEQLIAQVEAVLNEWHNKE